MHDYSIDPDLDGLHLATIPGSAGFSCAHVRRLNRTTSNQLRKRAEGAIGHLRESSRLAKEFQSRLWEALPSSLRLACPAVVLYVVVNFVAVMILMEGGSAAIENGQPILHDHGQFIRNLTVQEYQRFLAYETRLMTGHSMLFSMFPAVYLLVIHARCQDQNASVTSGRTT